MTEPRPLPPPDRESGPSLAGRALGWRPELSGGRRLRIALAVLALLGLLGLSLTVTRMTVDTERPASAPSRILAGVASEPLSATLAALSGTLPEGARIAEVARADQLTLIAETAEPDRLREALARDPALARLRTTGEAALADGGYRVMLEEPGAAPVRRPAAALPDPARLAALARQHRLLVERIGAARLRAINLVVSGRESDVRAFATAVETGRPAARLPRWKLSALGGGAIRLDAHVEGAARPAEPKTPDARPLFSTTAAPPLAADAPTLAGIVGRLPDNAVALVRGEDGRAVSVSPGQETPGGWRLEALSADAAIFTRGNERARVPLLLE